MDIDLGRKSPELASIPSPPSDKGEDNVYYPDVYIDGGKELDEIPDEGTITFRYKKVRETTEKRDGKKTSHSVNLKLFAITDTTSESSEEKEDSGAELDKLAKEVAGEGEGED